MWVESRSKRVRKLLRRDVEVAEVVRVMGRARMR